MGFQEYHIPSFSFYDVKVKTVNLGFRTSEGKLQPFRIHFYTYLEYELTSLLRLNNITRTFSFKGLKENYLK